MKLPLISIVVIAYNMERELPRTLYTLLSPYQMGIRNPDIEIIVVDNGSSDDTCKIDNPVDLELHKNFVYIRNEENLGFAKACNIGFAKSSGEHVCFLNNDIRVKDKYETWTQTLIDAAKDGALVGPTGGLLDNNLNFITELEEFHDGHFI